MKELRPLTDKDRILVLSPHPDDESLATGGLIQVALEAGAKVRVIYASNGDNNPWPQRVAELKLRIDAGDRERWGNLRRTEALDALAHLGLEDEESAGFLGFPDQGFNDAVLNLDNEPLAALKREIATFRPTIMVTPSLHDRHPDHNSLAVFVSLALQQVRLPVERFVYLVHTDGRTPLNTKVALTLTPGQQQRKREAIARHGSQIRLSRGRLLRHARPVETFYKPVPPEDDHEHHPVVSAHLAGGHLHFSICAAQTPRFPAKLYIAMESLMNGGVRWMLPLPRRSGRIVVRNAITNVEECEGIAEVTKSGLTIRIPVSDWEPLNQLFIKLKPPTLFFDRTGWREVSVLPLDGKELAAVGSAEQANVKETKRGLNRSPLAWTIFPLLALVWLGAVLSQHIRKPWVNLVDYNGAVWSQAAHNILRAGITETEGASTGFYFGPLPIPPAGFYLHHPPLLHLLLTWLFGLFGEHEWVARLLPIACSLASGVCIWHLVRSCAGVRAAAFSVGIFACLPMELRYGRMVNFEPLVLLVILGALCCLRQWHVSGRARWKMFALGLLMTGMWVDWAMYIFVLVLCTYWLAKPSLKMRRTASFVLASALFFAALYLLRIQILRPDAWNNLTSALVRRMGNTDIGIHFTQAQWARRIANMLWTHFLPVGWIFCAAGAVIVWRKKSTDTGLAWLGWACTVVAIMDAIFVGAFQNDSYIHQYIAFYLVAPVAMLGGVALDAAAGWMQRRLHGQSAWRFAGTCIPCLVLVAAAYSGLMETRAMHRQFLVLDFKTSEPPDLIPRLGETIRENFAPHTYVLCNFLPVYGPQLGYYAQRNLLNNVSKYRYWHTFLTGPLKQNLGGVVWMNSPGAKEIVAKLPPGSKKYFRFGDQSFCIWKPTVAIGQSANVVPAKPGQS